MSNNKQSRIYQFVELLNKGANNLGNQTTIINAYEKVVRKNDALKEHIEKLILDLQDKKKIISNLEEDIKLMQSNVIDKEVLFEEENEKLKQKVKDLDMKILNESLNKASWHNTYEADIQALKGNLQCTDDMNKRLNEENEKLKKNLEISYNFILKIL